MVLFTVMAKFRKGLSEWPEVYLSMIFSAIGIGTLITITIPREINHDSWTARYKRYYTVYRPNDPRLVLYPKDYITDKEFLPADHPEKSRDVKFFLLPKSDVHRVSKD